MSDVVAVTDSELTAAATRGAGVLNGSGLVVAPVGGTYGLLANVASPAAIDRVFAARGAPRSAPLGVIIHNPRALPTFVQEVPEEADRLVSAYWPGPLTLIFRLADALDWHLGESAGHVALRMPAEPLSLMLISKVGPLACTAAAPAGAPAPTTVADAQAGLADAVDLYLDGGPRDGTTSTVVDVSRGRAEVLRVGEVPAHHVAQVAAGELPLGSRPVDPPEGEDAASGETTGDGDAESPPTEGTTGEEDEEPR